MTISTPRGGEVRATVETRLQEARRAGGDSETVRVEWRGQPANLPVITMPVEDLYYNPQTHRVRAQRAHDPVRDAELCTDPWSPASQGYLHELLKAKPDNPDAPDPAFEKLKRDLKEFGQNDAGIITPSGILVNGNTRRAALKELGLPHIRVAVLPADADWSDIDAVELELQLRADHRREYSYINRLIAIHEQISSGRPKHEIIKAFRTTADAVNRDLWVYNFLTDAIERSRTALDSGAAARLRLMDFEGHQESLKELHRHLRGVDDDEAEVIKESRLLAILMNTAKTKLRFIREDFHTKYLRPRLDDRFAAQEGTQDTGAGGLPGFDLGPDLEIAADTEEVRHARAATDAVLTAKVKQAFSSSLSAGEVEEASDLLDTVEDALDRGVAGAEAAFRRNQRKLAAAERLSEAVGLVRECTEQVAQARSQDLLQQEALDSSIVELSKALKQLSRHASRGAENPGPGLSWLQDAVADL